MKNCWYALLASLLLMPAASMAQSKTKGPYVVPNSGATIYGTTLTSDTTGNLRLALKAGASRNFRRGTYKTAWTPEPKEVKAAKAIIRTGNMAGALKELESAYRKYRYVGWAGDIGLYRAKILLKMNKNADAEQACRDALGMPNSDLQIAKLKQGLIKAMLAQNKTDAAKKELVKMRTTDPKVAAFVFNARGQMLEKEGKPKEAILQYLKTVLLFDKSVGSVRQDAYRQVVSILETLKDSRAATFKARYAKES
jgi:tetratricopeptide (TPR) repeat protein